jgi:hypothetical protein
VNAVAKAGGGDGKKQGKRLLAAAETPQRGAKFGNLDRLQLLAGPFCVRDELACLGRFPSLRSLFAGAFCCFYERDSMAAGHSQKRANLGTPREIVRAY